MIPVVQQDVVDRLRRNLTTDEVSWLAATVDEASALIEGYLGVTYAVGDDVPEAVIVVTSRVVARILTMAASGLPSQMDSVTRGMGSFSATTQFTADATSGGPWLTKSDRMTLAQFRLGGAMTIPLVRETGRVTVPDEGS